MDNLDTTIKALEALILRAQAVSGKHDGTPFVVLDHNQRADSLEGLQTNPSRKRGTPVFTRADSFVEYVKEQALECSRLYVTSPTCFVCVIDHHESGNLAGWGQHRATLNLKASAEWTLWTQSNGKRMGQREFAQFIEDNSTEVESPTGAQLLELVRTIKATTNAEFSGQVEEKDGNFSVGFSMTTRTAAGQKGELELPTDFVLMLSHYEGGPAHSLPVRLRFSIEGGRLALWYEMVKVAKFQEQMLASIVSAIEEETEMTAWYGTPTP